MDQVVDSLPAGNAAEQGERLRPGGAGTWLLILGLGLGLVVWLAKAAHTPLPEGDILSWSDKAAKEKVADLLNRSVLIPGFKAELHEVQNKENFWSIARAHKINIDTILGMNPEMQGLAARLKQPLLVANVKGALHQVRQGEGLDSIAALYEIKPAELKAANRVSWSGAREGQLLWIPGVKPRQVSEKIGVALKRRSMLRSPLNGKYTSLIGTRSDPFTGTKTHHNGVDIKAPYNEPVAASASGTVVYAGWNGGFGKCVKIDHHNGYVTLYGHLNAIYVRVGQEVKQYQLVGKVGSTGRSTGPHLHFTIYYEGQIKNPLEYLW